MFLLENKLEFFTAPGLVVTSISATWIRKSSLQSAKELQAFRKSRQAGHHGAWLIFNINKNQSMKNQRCQKPTVHNFNMNNLMITKLNYNTRRYIQ